MRPLLLVAALLELSGASLVPSPALRPEAPPRRCQRSASLRMGAFALKPTVPLAADVGAAYAKTKIGVLLLNLGGPDDLDAVEPFLYNLFSDPEIITLPSSLGWLNGPIAKIISKTRAPTSREGYAAIGGGSPQLDTTIKQGQALEAAMRKLHGIEAKSYVAMRYWYPFTSDALEAIKRDGIERLVVVPLYPQFSISTSGSSLRVLEKEFYADQELRQMRNTVLPAWYNREGYINAMARLVAQRIDAMQERDGVQGHVFFSAHGLPAKYIDELGDPYQQQIEANAKFVMQRLAATGYGNNWTLAYQSRVGPVEWLRPYTDDTIRQLCEEGVDALVVVPISFVSEHIETLEEIDMEYRELAEECGVRYWERVPCLQLEQDFIDDLAGAVVESLPKMDERPLQEINEGRPVSLRVVNDLIELKTKESAIEYGPVKYQQQRRIGLTPKAELINGRIAMAAITAATGLSISQGTFLNELLDGRLPQSWF